MSTRGQRYASLLAGLALLTTTAAAPNPNASEPTTVTQTADKCEPPHKPVPQLIKNLAPGVNAAEPNLGFKKLELAYFKCSRAYDRRLDEVVQQAQHYIESRLRSARTTDRLAIVLDIDETALSNWPELEASDFGFTVGDNCTLGPNRGCAFDAWIKLAQAKAITPTLALFRFALEQHIAVFFVTARREADQRADTIKNLTDEHYVGWTALYMCGPGVCGPDNKLVQKFKAEQRAKIEAQGFQIIANIGDQFSDLAGAHADRAFKLPNPFYFIP